MKNASLWRDAAELPDPPDPGEEYACPECGIYPSDVTDGYTLAGEDEEGRDSYVPINPTTGCLCSPEDLDPPAVSDEEWAERNAAYDKALMESYTTADMAGLFHHLEAAGFTVVAVLYPTGRNA